MVKDFDQVPKKHVLPKYGKNWQRYCVAWHGNQRFRRVRQPIRGMLRKIAAAK
jgi:hypothetical protein